MPALLKCVPKANFDIAAPAWMFWKSISRSSAAEPASRAHPGRPRNDVPREPIDLIDI